MDFCVVAVANDSTGQCVGGGVATETNGRLAFDEQGMGVCGHQAKPATEIGQETVTGASVSGDGGVFFQHAPPTTDQESISGRDQGDVSFTNRATSALLIQAWLRLRLLKAALDGPAGTGRGPFSQGRSSRARMPNRPSGCLPSRYGGPAMALAGRLRAVY